jgi:hypothetical protein
MTKLAAHVLTLPRPDASQLLLNGTGTCAVKLAPTQSASYSVLLKCWWKFLPHALSPKTLPYKNQIEDAARRFCNRWFVFVEVG